RPIVVTDQAPPSTAAAKASSSAKLSASDATAVFVSAASPDAEAKLPDAPVRATSRRVPQWVFLDRIFPDVVLADVGAAAMARGGTRVAHVRRALLGAGIAAALFVSVGVLRSWLGNRSLAQRTAVAARDVAALPVVTTAAGTMAFPSADALRRLDALRTVLDTLHAYTTSAVPNRLQWGLWQGNALLSPGRRVWLEGYRRQLHASAYGALVDSLRALPVSPRPSDEYGQDYGMLKAYLIMTSESPRSTPDFLAPVLLSSWTRGQPVDADVLALARRQFEFYALGLALENPWPQAADARLVNHTRDFLNRFTGGEQIYLYMLAQADKVVQPVRFAESVPQASGVVTALPEVQGAFTRPGWEFMENAFRNSDRFFEGEQWVVGDATARQTEDRDAILAQLRARYRNEYLQRWRGFVRSAAVARPVGNREAGARDAARRLGIVGGAQSPLLATLSLVARNTAVDSGVAAAFQPVHTVTPPEATDKYVNDGNQQYVSALVGLQGALEQVTYLPPAVDTPSTQAIQQAAQQALGQVTQAKLAARQLAQKFAVDTAAAQVGPAVAVLLESPINGADGVLRALVGLRPPSSRPAVVAPPAGGGGGGAPPAPPPGGGGASRAAAELAAILNERGAAICSAMTPMLAKFPFNPDASAEATVAEVVGLLAPGTGQLPAFQQERLADLMEKQGGQWVAKGGGLVALSAPFISFFNRASQVSAALFGAGSTPRVVFHAHGIATPQMPNVTLLHGTNMARFNQSSVPAQFVWPAPSGREARLIAQFGREKEREIAKTTGEWALFRLVAQSTKTDVTGPAEFRSQWNATGKGAVPVDVVFRFESGMPVAQRGWLGGMSCISQVTR
ncbi:MAG: ImcF-related family protein, partial [Gemmatimonadaceae bacterium]